MEPLLFAVLFLVLASEFVNGWTDAPNAIATVVSTRVLSPRLAVVLAVSFNVIGTLVGTEVAKTIGKGIVKPDVIGLETIAAAMLGIIVWSSTAARFGLPTSESHALVSGMAGAGLAWAGPAALLGEGWKKVFIGIGFSSVLGLCLAWIIGKVIVATFAHRAPTRTRRLFDRLQIFSATLMAFNHGQNDGQKFIGVFTLALLLGGKIQEFTVSPWVILLCAGTMGIGTAIGGWRIVRMLGERMTNIESWQGFAAEFSASSTIFLASAYGIPLSTTHTIGTSIMGAAASRRASAVRWRHARNIVYAWLLTFPICGAISYLACLLLKRLL